MKPKIEKIEKYGCENIYIDGRKFSREPDGTWIYPGWPIEYDDEELEEAYKEYRRML